MTPMIDDKVFAEAIKRFSSEITRRNKVDMIDGEVVKVEHSPNHVEYTLTGFCNHYNIPIKMIAHIKRDVDGNVSWFIEQNTQRKPQQPGGNPFADMFRTGQP